VLAFWKLLLAVLLARLHTDSRLVLSVIVLWLAGATDEHRALNYLAVRYPRIYEQTTEMFAGNSSLTAVETRPSRLSGTRKIIDVIFSYSNRQTDVIEKYFARVDVTEMWPFLVTKLSPYYDR
jgi:hypothetical protein